MLQRTDIMYKLVETDEIFNQRRAFQKVFLNDTNLKLCVLKLFERYIFETA